MGIGMAFIWSPLAATATRNLPPQLAGAGSGVYNTTRQVGGVLGSAAMAALMTSQISAALPPELNPGVGQGAVTRLPSFLHEPFSAALSRSLLLPAFVALVGVIAALFLRGFASAPANRLVAPRSPGEPDYFPDDDDYVEYTVDWSAMDDDVDRGADVRQHHPIAADESATSPLAVHVEHPLPAPADSWHGGPVDTWHSLMNDQPAVLVADDEPETVPELIAISEPYRAPEPIPVRNGHAPWHSILDEVLDGPFDGPIAAPKPEPIGFAHNGFHGAGEPTLKTPPTPSRRGGRHSREEKPADDDAGTYGRHSMRFRD
jgi:hypothetical protein